ncbi:MAG: nucleotidyltransferase domain-containing protein [Candidatus Nanohaloarchaea archaeon]|nr:nucleotidyltransferase domain-containing protein [Candidatus Nanohaloarchaea archaeon]
MDTEGSVREAVEESAQTVLPGYDVVAAYLYGSYARGEEHSDSDVDIAVYFRDYSLDKLLEVGRRLQEEADVGREVDVRSLNGADLVFQRNVLKDAELLYEKDPEARARFERSVYNRYLDMKPYIQQYYGKRRERISGAVA